MSRRMFSARHGDRAHRRRRPDCPGSWRPRPDNSVTSAGDRGHQVGVAQIAARPQPTHAQGRDQHRRRNRHPLGPAIAPFDLVIGRDKAGLGKDHLAEKPGQKERPAGAPPGADGLPSDAKGPRHAHHQPVNRRAFLGAGGEIDPAQHVAILESGCPETPRPETPWRRRAPRRPVRESPQSGCGAGGRFPAASGPEAGRSIAPAARRTRRQRPRPATPRRGPCPSGRVKPQTCSRSSLPRLS